MSGLRKSEQFALTRADILLESETLQVNKQRPASVKGETTSPKTESGARYVDIVGPVKEVLLEVATRDVNAGPDALIFTTSTGAPIQHRNFDRRVWVPLMKRAGFWVPDSRDPKRGRPLYKPPTCVTPSAA